MTIFADFYNRF